MRLAMQAMAVITTLLAAVQPAQGEPVAVLAAIKGKVTVTSARARAKASTPASFGTSLERGDRISVGAGSSATLFFNDGNILEVGEGSTMTISGRVSSGAAATMDKLQKETFASVTRFCLKGSRNQGLVAAPALRSTGLTNDPQPLSPRNTDLLDARPTFAWRAAPGAIRYVVKLSGTPGEVWTRESQTTSLVWPADAAPLADGEYVWDVQAFDANGPASKAASTFRLVPEVEMHAIRGVVDRIHEIAGGKDTPAAHYLAGAYLCERGFLVDATEEFTALLRLAPDSPVPHRALGDIYSSVGLADLASAAYQRARTLSPDR